MSIQKQLPKASSALTMGNQDIVSRVRWQLGLKVVNSAEAQIRFELHSPGKAIKFSVMQQLEVKSF